MKQFVFLVLMIFSVCSIADSLSDSNKLLDWAEVNYPQYFSPAGAETIEISGYVARYYSDTGNYLGTKDNKIYVYGDIFNGMLYVGELTKYTAQINSDSESGTFDLKEYSQNTEGSYSKYIESESGKSDQYVMDKIIGTEILDGITVFQDAFINYYGDKTYNENNAVLKDASLIRFDDTNFYFYGEKQFIVEDDEIVGVYKFTPALTIPRYVKVGDNFSGSFSMTDPNGSVIFEGNWEYIIIEYISSISIQGKSYNNCLKKEFRTSEEGSSSQDIETSIDCKDIGGIYWTDNDETQELIDYYIAN